MCTSKSKTFLLLSLLKFVVVITEIYLNLFI